MFSNLLFRKSPRLHLKYCMVSSAFKYNVSSRCKNAIYFAQLAWLFLRGKLTFITTEQATSNGGYKYLALIISKRPLSDKHTYEDIGGA